MRTGNESILITANPLRELRDLVALFNDKRRSRTDEGPHAELRRLVSSWVQSGPNLEKVFAANSRIESESLRGWTLRLIPTAGGRAMLSAFPPLLPRFDDFTDYVLPFFVRLILNPECERLGGPCERCGAFYLKKRPDQKTYCSKRCRSFATATEASRNRSKKKHKEILQLACEGIRAWEGTGRKQEWKDFVCRFVNKRRQEVITAKTLTRAVNKGELASPALP